MRAITLYAFSSLNSAYFHHIFPLPTVLTLRNSQIYIHSPNSNDIASHIKVSIDEAFHPQTILYIPNVELNNRHVRFWQYFDDSQSQSKDDVIEDMIILDNFLNYIKYDLGSFYIV